MTITINSDDLDQILIQYLKNLESEFLERWNLLTPSMNERDIIEVICGLLSRQIAITNYYLQSPRCWNGDIGTIILRTICENIINISWILKADSINRAKMFIIHGLGQEKLQIEHRKREMENRETSEDENEMIENMEDFLNQERYTIITDVNLGSWSEKSILKLAEESDCLDIYHFAFTPFSNSAHGTWNHIFKYSLKDSTNPLHNLLKRPIFYNFEPEFYYAKLAMSYMSESFKIFDNYFNQNLSCKDSYEIFSAQLEELIVDER